MSDHNPGSSPAPRRVAGVRFPGASQVHFVSADHPDVRVGTWVAVRTEWGDDAAFVVIAPEQVVHQTVAIAELPGCRPLEGADLERMDLLRHQAKAVTQRSNVIATGLGLDLEVTSCAFSLDGSHMVVFWKAPEIRHTGDLRDQLGREYNIAVELRRIGFEGESRLIGGLGPSIPVPGARQPSNEVSRENERYRELKRGIPQLGQRVRTNEGLGTVIGINVFDQIATVRFDESGGEVTLPTGDIQHTSI